MTRVLCRGFPILVLPVVLVAQQPGDTALLKPVVVTATRIPTPADLVPVAITVISGAELREQGVLTVFDALRAVPGAAVVQTGSFGGQTSLFLRGGQSDYVKVLVDGVPVNQPGGAFDFANLSPDNIDRIEVLRGPASVLYGSDAVTGVVQIFTRRGIGTARAEASVRGGTYGTLIEDAQASGGSEAASYSVAVSRFTSDGVYAFNNHYGSTVVSGLVQVAPDDRTDATVSIRYDDNVYHFPTNGAGTPVDHNQFNYESGPTVGLDVGRALTQRLEARLLLALNESDGGFDNRPDSAGDTLGFYGDQSLDHLRRASADLRADLRLGGATMLTGGGAFELESERSFDASQSQFGNATDQVAVRRRNAAYYAQAVTDVAGRVALTAGVRLEDNERFGTFVTYRVGAAYRLATGTRLRASAGNGFREPSFFENYATGFVTGNPNLRPEHSRSWEVGVEQALAAGRATLSAGFFDQRFVDLIDYNPSALAGAPNYANVAGATANGVELGVRLVPLGPITLEACYTYLHTAVTNPGFDSSSGAGLAAGQPLTRRPRDSARLDVGYRARDRGTLSLAVTYVGDRADQDFSTFPFRRVTLPAYTRVDVAGVLDVLQPRVSVPGLALTARVENVFDRAYQEVRNFPARRRTLLFGGRMRLGS